MAARLEFFPVDNGDMTLVTLDSGRKILIDCNIRGAADDEDDDTPDVGSLLRDRLDRGGDGRLYVDAFLLSHPDKDHCSGLENHFHLGAPGKWVKKDDKIIIREMWSSPIVFRRKDRSGTLCADAEAWRNEARRRVKLFRDGKAIDSGDRIIILGEDCDGKTDDLEDILVRINDELTLIDGEEDGTFSAILLGPMGPHEDEEEEELLAKNRSSVIMQFAIDADGEEAACLFLSGGDAEVAIWERQWERHKDDASPLEYDVLQTPHHCSWHSLSYDSWSDCGEDAEVAPDALSALSQAREGAIIVASCKTITDDDADPPCVRAEREFQEIADNADGELICVADHVDDGKNDLLLLEITSKGPKKKTAGAFAIVSGGPPGKTDKKGGGRYARRAA